MRSEYCRSGTQASSVVVRLGELSLLSGSQRQAGEKPPASRRFMGARPGRVSTGHSLRRFVAGSSNPLPLKASPLNSMARARQSAARLDGEAAFSPWLDRALTMRSCSFMMFAKRANSMLGLLGLGVLGLGFCATTASGTPVAYVAGPGSPATDGQASISTGTTYTTNLGYAFKLPSLHLRETPHDQRPPATQAGDQPKAKLPGAAHGIHTQKTSFSRRMLMRH